MLVYSINNSDSQGGAARAAYRIHRAVRKLGVDSRMVVARSQSGDYTVQGPATKWQKMVALARPQLGGLARLGFRTGNAIIHSASWVPSGRVQALNHGATDLLHLHWLQGEMLSVADIGHLRKPLVWTLHDMWAFCGAEHCTEETRYRAGYLKNNRPAYESGWDLNRWTWQRKHRHWRQPLQIVTPSRWLAECVQSSALMRSWPVRVIPNPLDTDTWKPIEKLLARELLGLPADVPLIAFGAAGGTRERHKGFDLLEQALGHLRVRQQKLELLVFGQLAPPNPPDRGFPVHYLGHLHDDLTLRALYSAADAFILPSRIDNLPNTGVESLACGTPVVAFNTCGLPDIVQHQQTGYLAQPFDPRDLANGIAWVLEDPQRHARLSTAARDHAVRHFDETVVAPQYVSLYEQILARHAVAAQSHSQEIENHA